MSQSMSRDHLEITTSLCARLDAIDGLPISVRPLKRRPIVEVITSVVRFFDRRSADRASRVDARRRHDAVAQRPRRHSLEKAVRDQMLDAMPSWHFDQRSKAFVPSVGMPLLRGAMLDELLDAVTDLQNQVVLLRVSGLMPAEAARVRGYLQRGSELVVINHLMCEPTAQY